jgi:hypothetical protein
MVGKKQTEKWMDLVGRNFSRAKNFFFSWLWTRKGGKKKEKKKKNV